MMLFKVLWVAAVMGGSPDLTHADETLSFGFNPWVLRGMILPNGKCILISAEDGSFETVTIELKPLSDGDLSGKYVREKETPFGRIEFVLRARRSSGPDEAGGLSVSAGIIREGKTEREFTIDLEGGAKVRFPMTSTRFKLSEPDCVVAGMEIRSLD